MIVSTARSARAAIVLTALLAPLPAAAHSLESLQQDLFDTEKYFQAVDKETPDFALQDADGRAVRMTDFRGKVVVLHFIYTFCPDVCPLHAERIAEIQDMINQTPMKDQVQFVTITTDPRRDTGDVLRDYAIGHGFDSANWVFLTAAPDQPEDVTRKLAKAYGLEFTETEDGDQIHGVVTHVIDQNGRLRARFHGLGFEPTNLVLFVNGLLNANVPHKEPDPSIWSRIRTLF